MKHRLAALAFATTVVAAAPLALADIPNPTSSSSGSGGTSSTGTTGSGGDGSGKDDGGCAASRGPAGGSAAALIGLGLLGALALVRRRAARA